MKKETQLLANEIASNVFRAARTEMWVQSTNGGNVICRRLNKCNAFVIETPNFYLLRSYQTFVGAIRKSDNTCVNYMHHEYDFKGNNCTGATTTRQFYKFVKQYSPDYENARIITWKAV